VEKVVGSVGGSGLGRWVLRVSRTVEGEGRLEKGVILIDRGVSGWVGRIAGEGEGEGEGGPRTEEVVI